MGFSFPEQCKIVKCYQGAANAVSCDTISCKNVNKLWFVVIHTGSSDTDLTLSLYEATDVASGTNAAITDTCPIWNDTDMGTTSDTLARTTDAYSYTIDTGNYPNQMAVIEWDPAKFSAGYDCVYLADSGGNASNTVTIFAVCDMRYQADQPPVVITD